MKAKIDNKILEVKIIDPNYNEYAVEVEIMEGSFKGKDCIVEKIDLIEEPKKMKYKISDVEYHKGTSMFMGEYKTIWAATIGRIELSASCRTKKEAMDEARKKIKRLNEKM